MLRPQNGGSVQVMRSTTGDLQGDDKNDRSKSGAPLNAPPDVEVEDTK